MVTKASFCIDPQRTFDAFGVFRVLSLFQNE